MHSYTDISELVTGYPLDKVVVFDTETTGLHPYEDEIVSISIMDGMRNTLLDTYVRPTSAKSWPESEAIHGISPSMVRGCPTIDRLGPQIRNALCGDKLIVGYNVNFDLQFLTEVGVIEYPRHTFDVMDEFARIRGRGEKRNGRYRWSKLSQMAEHYGYDYVAHKSANDTRATLYCYLALLSDKKYIDEIMGEFTGDMARVSFRQGEREKASIFRLLNGARSADFPANLVLDEVTRGKNAGMPRYACMIGDECVGVTSPHEVETVRRFFVMDYNDP